MARQDVARFINGPHVHANVYHAPAGNLAGQVFAGFQHDDTHHLTWGKWFSEQIFQLAKLNDFFVHVVTPKGEQKAPTDADALLF
jgi:hypothetical protein